jgi:LysR family glycine cleavage system transcriptional activator
VSSRHTQTPADPFKRLPPLEAIRMFEAVARLGSTVAAARELRLTHGAVSRRIRGLEDHLATPLLERGRGGRLVPTEAGTRFAETARQALGMLAEAADAAGRGAARQSAVRINTTASFAALWLIPRQHRFRSRYPAFELWVSESQSLIEPGAISDIDVAIRSGDGKWPGVRSERLMDDVMIPVSAPGIAAQLFEPADLAHVTLLQDEDPAVSWQQWMQAAGLGNPDWASRGPRLASTLLLMQAAAAGDGVALVPAHLASSHIERGHLINPFAVKFDKGPSYWLVRPQRGLSSPAIRAFCAWLRAETRNDNPDNRSA